VNDVEAELQKAKDEKADLDIIENLEKKLVEVKAELEHVGQEGEALLKEKDEVLRGKLPGRTDKKTELEATDQGMCNKTKHFFDKCFFIDYI
jgi:hypothetical protein